MKISLETFLIMQSNVLAGFVTAHGGLKTDTVADAYYATKELCELNKIEIEKELEPLKVLVEF